VGDIVPRLEEPMSALDRLDAAAADTLRLVLGQRAPDVLKALEETEDPPTELRERVGRAKFSGEVSGPDWEPSPHGVRVDDALGWFYRSFPVERS
jgi:hypothetical protein